VADSGKLSSYFHFRDPVLFMKKSLLQKSELDKAIDFLDPIDTDVPRGGENVYENIVMSTMQKPVALQNVL